ncbi:hypothetical protein [Micropruina sp.]|uniref:hypothetical protein n=1 Tax=Micropruina sp. TaxID=2737536 RepID=UPI0039E21E43
MSWKDLPAEVIRTWVHENTDASFRLEGRELPDDYVRSPEVQRFIDSVIAQLDRLDGTDPTAVRGMTGLDDEELDDLCGLPD